MLQPVYRIFLILPVLLLLHGGNVCWAADYQKGLTAAQSGDYATALREWTPLAEQGYAVAQHNLGAFYANGQGIPQDDKTAVKWLRLAAEQGNATAQTALNFMYRQGRVVPQDVKRSPSQSEDVPSVKTRKSPQTPSQAADASDFRIAPSPKQVSEMNDIDLCKHDYVRELPFIQAAVKKRFLDCTAILSVMVEQKRQEQQARMEAERKRLAAEEREKVQQAEREREAAEQARLRAEAAQIEQQRRRLVELQE